MSLYPSMSPTTAGFLLEETITTIPTIENGGDGDDIPFESKVYAIMVKCTSVPSIMGSTYIAFEVLRNKRKRAKTYHRLLLAMSISDILSSTAIFVGSWAIPRDTPGIYLAYGNDTTCRIQGFFIQLGIITPLYNGMLAIYYLFSINRGWKEYQIHSIEIYLHAVPLLWGFGTAIFGSIFDIFDPASLWCWMGNQREIHKVLRYLLYYAPVIVMLFLTTAIMINIYKFVRHQEKAVEKYDLERKIALENSNSHNHHQSSDGFRKRVSYMGKGLKDMIVGVGINDSGSMSMKKPDPMTNGESEKGSLDAFEGHYDSKDNSDAESDAPNDSDVEEDDNDDSDDEDDEEDLHHDDNVSDFSADLERDMPLRDNNGSSGQLTLSNNGGSGQFSLGNNNITEQSLTSSPGALAVRRRASTSLRHSIIVEDLSNHFDDDQNTLSHENLQIINGDHNNQQQQQAAIDANADSIAASDSTKDHQHDGSFSIYDMIRSKTKRGSLSVRAVRSDQMNSSADEHDDSKSDDGSMMDALTNSFGRGNKERRNLRRKTKHSRRVMIQSMWYVLAFYLSFMFATTARIYGSVNGTKAPFPLLLLFSIFFPLQGFFNFLVYMRSQRRSRTSGKRNNHSNNRQVRRGSTPQTWKTGSVLPNKTLPRIMVSSDFNSSATDSRHLKGFSESGNERSIDS